MAMRPQIRLLVTLAATLALAAGAAAYAYYGVFVADRDEAAKKDAEATLLRFDRDALTRLQVTARGETTVLERRDGTWKVVAPVAADADEYAVTSLLDRLAAAKRKTALPDGASPARFGLEPATTRVVATTPAGEAALAIGATNEFDGSLYARADAGRIVTAEGGLRNAVEKTPFDLREKRPWTFDPARVRRIRVEGTDPAWTAERDGAGWKLAAPVAGKADGTAVDRVLGALRTLRATAIPAEAGADGRPFGLDRPRATVTLDLEGGGTQALALGETGPADARKVFARSGSGFVAEVTARTLEDVAPSPFELGDKTILSFDREAVARVEFEGEEGFAVTRARGATPDQETFALAAPRQAPAKRWKMAGALQELAGLKAAAWADEHARDLAKYGLDRPRRTIVVRDAAGGELARLLVGTVEGDRVHVMAAGAARVALVDKARVDALPNRVADVEDAATPETKAE
jgi:hypothetical protein